MALAYALVGLVAGIVVGLTSTGGGAILTPALIVLLGVPARVAVGTDVLIAAVMKLVGSGVYAARREVDWRTVWKLAAGSVPGAALGALILRAVPREALDATLARGVGGAIALGGIATVTRIVLAERVRPVEMPGTARTIALGLLTGVLVSLTSIGSGSVLVCLLALFFPLPARTVVGTDIVHALILSVAATVAHLLAGRVDLALAASVLVGAIPGVLAGAQLAKATPERALRVGLAVLLVGIGAHLVVFGTPRKADALDASRAVSGRSR